MTKLKIACNFYQNDGLQSQNIGVISIARGPPLWLILYDIHVFAITAFQETGELMIRWETCFVAFLMYYITCAM